MLIKSEEGGSVEIANWQIEKLGTLAHEKAECKTILLPDRVKKFSDAFRIYKDKVMFYFNTEDGSTHAVSLQVEEVQIG